MEDFVSEDLAKKLRNKGCPDWAYCDTLYIPTISEVLKWLREKKKIAINIEYIPYTWMYMIIDMSFDRSFEPCAVAIFSDYEEAALAGIEYVLNNLI